jgi:hypothetical protein
LGWAGAVVAVLLVAGGLSFPVGGAVLSTALAASLLCLLAWVASAALVVVRQGPVPGPKG